MRYLQAGICSIGIVLSAVVKADIPCPPMPAAVTTITRDVKSDIEAKVGSLGVLKVGELGVKTDVAAKSIFEKYPSVDRLVALQTMAATYCAMIRETKLSDTEKLNRWETFQDKVLDLESRHSPPKPKPPDGNTNPGSPEEKAAFESATALHSSRAYQRFLQMFPHGSYASAVKLRLSECTTTSVAQDNPQEDFIVKTGSSDDEEKTKSVACSKAKANAREKLLYACTANRFGATLSGIEYEAPSISTVTGGGYPETYICEIDGKAKCSWTEHTHASAETCP